MRILVENYNAYKKGAVILYLNVRYNCHTAHLTRTSLFFYSLRKTTSHYKEKVSRWLSTLLKAKKKSKLIVPYLIPQ